MPAPYDSLLLLLALNCVPSFLVSLVGGALAEMCRCDGPPSSLQTGRDI